MVGSVRKFTLLALVAAFGTVGCDGAAPTEAPAPSFSSSTGAFTATAPIAGTFDNPCSGESFFVEGQSHVTIQEVTNGNTTSFVVHSTLHGVGTSESGTTYTLTDVSTQRLWDQSNTGAFQFEIVQRGKMVSGSSTDNATFSARVLVVFNGSEFVVEILEIGFSCTG